MVLGAEGRKSGISKIVQELIREGGVANTVIGTVLYLERTWERIKGLKL